MIAEYLCIAVLNMGMPNAEYACEQMEHVVNASADLDFQPEVLVALIHYESRWNPRAITVSNCCLHQLAYMKELKCSVAGWISLVVVSCHAPCVDTTLAIVAVRRQAEAGRMLGKYKEWRGELERR